MHPLRLAATVLPLFMLPFLMSCGNSTATSGPGSTIEANTGVSIAPAERLFVLEEDGLYEHTAGARVLVAERPDRSFIYDMAVSPDGKNVVLAVQGPPTQTPGGGYSFGVDLFLARQGGEPMLIAAHERIGETLARPNWLPDGRRLFFSVLGRDETGAADIRIELLDSQTGERQRFIEDALEPSLSPEATTLAYLQIDESGAEVVMLTGLDTGETRPLLPSDRIMSNVANIAWSPDGSRIAFAAADPIAMRGLMGNRAALATHPTLRDIWTVNVDGSGLHRIAELADANLALAWSADGRSIYAIGDTGLWRVDASNGAIELIGAANLAGRVQVLRVSP